MGAVKNTHKSWVSVTLSNPGFWFIVAVMALITVPHYADVLKHPSFVVSIWSSLELDRHAFERVLYLAPIVWAGFLFGWKGAFITSLAVLAIMAPRAFFFSDFQRDAVFEISAVFILGNVLAISFASLRRERDYRVKLEAAHQELRTSEERYRQLFENAHDGIWLHDLDGNFIQANRATERMTGYTAEELCKMNVKSFLSPDSLEQAREIRKKILNNEPVKPYEQHVYRRDGSVAVIEIATSLVTDKGKPAAFQHVARDITEQKRMSENLRFYLQQATRAQEEERKRISHELHDDTIQALVVLSRQLDALASDNSLPEAARTRLEQVWQQADNILQGVRRLSQDLRPAAIDRLGLLPAIQWLAAEVSKYSGVAIKVNVVGKEHRLPEETAIAMFRIIQEAMRNVWRHSGATTADVNIEWYADRVKVTVIDNGKGFKTPDMMGDLAKHGKLGLAGMQERAQLIGGTLTVHSESGKGTTIIIEAPG
jgi:PAS domain S-box-containing protein